MYNPLVYLIALMLSISVYSCKKTDDGKANVEVFHFYDTLYVDAQARTFLLNLPPDYNELDDFPLVIALHGLAGSASQMETDYRLTEKANAAHFVIAYAEGVRSDGLLGIRTWNAGACCDFAMQHNIDDVKFISELINHLTTTYRIHPKKVYVTGMSNGAMMAYRLACEIPHQVAAIAPVSGTLLTAQPCTPSRTVPVLHIHSALDNKVPYNGGVALGGYYFPPVDSALTVWAGINGCDPEAQVVTDTTLYTFSHWAACNNGTTVERYLTKDGGHSWPGGSPARPGADQPSQAFIANDVIWEFFKRYSLP